MTAKENKNELNEGTDNIDEKKKCFVIMPISDNKDYSAGHFGRVYEHLIAPAVSQSGYLPVRADDYQRTDCIPITIIRDIVNAELVICDLSSKNPNVMYELGIRHAFSRPTVLIKDDKTSEIFDVQSLRYLQYESSLRIDSVQKSIPEIVSFILETVSDLKSKTNSLIDIAKISPATSSDADHLPKFSEDAKFILMEMRSLFDKYHYKTSESVSGSPIPIPPRMNYNRIARKFADTGAVIQDGDRVYNGSGKFLGYYLKTQSEASGTIQLKNRLGAVISYALNFQLFSKERTSSET
ncbi:hypothetical protein GCM10011497_06800 [Elstera cyanobacteriorum]|uniref:hypothetical protein n=1 Tax=Elstera cyanobacteriorum TaxID=2022747 RepID=UPI00114081F2|nr:hypothetical protein [Elstera cyanobacteriorum]GFZ80882.1 hypothetical protein GCM10011497_06800 [Elstera cyanobacteriorum]